MCYGGIAVYWCWRCRLRYLQGKSVRVCQKNLRRHTHYLHRIDARVHACRECLRLPFLPNFRKSLFGDTLALIADIQGERFSRAREHSHICGLATVL